MDAIHWSWPEDIPLTSFCSPWASLALLFQNLRFIQLLLLYEKERLWKAFLLCTVVRFLNEPWNTKLPNIVYLTELTATALIHLRVPESKRILLRKQDHSEKLISVYPYISLSSIVDSGYNEHPNILPHLQSTCSSLQAFPLVSSAAALSLCELIRFWQWMSLLKNAK